MRGATINELADHPLVKGLPPGAVERLSASASEVEFGVGEAILAEGGAAGVLYLLRSGKVALSAHAPGKGHLLVQTLGAGEVLGLSWLFPPFQWKFDAHAIEAVQAFAFDGARLRAKLDEDPVLGYALLKRITPVVLERLQQTRIRLLDLYGEAPAAAQVGTATTATAATAATAAGATAATAAGAGGPAGATAARAAHPSAPPHHQIR